MDFLTFRTEVLKLAGRCEGRVSLMIESGNRIIELNSRESYSSASLIKIPILIEGFRQKDNGILDLEQHIPVLPVKRVGGSGVLQVLSEDLKMKIIDLMALMMIVSDNTATNLLIDRIGKFEINDCIKALQLKSTELNRKMMDFTALKNGVDNITTANDMITCLKAIDQRKFLSLESSRHAIKIMENQQFKNKLADSIDLEKIEVANKTGELPRVEHDCAIIRHGSKTIYAAVLIDQLSSQEIGRQTLAQIGKLINRYLMSL